VLQVSTSSPQQFAAHLPKGTPPELIAIIEDAMRDTLDRHGASAFMASREAAIAHEAGHTIVMTHEGLTVESVRIFSRSVLLGRAWSGWCAEKDGEWTSGPDTSAESDLSRARVIIAGLAGEAITRLDTPGSSLDELALSQFIGHNAAAKLADPHLSDAEYDAFVQQLWHERVWRRTLAILDANRDPFMRLVEHLHRHETVKGSKLRAVLAQIRRIAR
jgi:hypothetical protein